MKKRRAVLLLAVSILVSATTSLFAQEPPSTTEVSIQEDSSSGGLGISNSLLPGNTLSFLSCEGILFGEPTTATPLFAMDVSADPNAPGAHWTVKDNTYSYTWQYPEGIKLEFAGTVTKSGLQLRYTLTNTTEKTLRRVLLHTCIPTTDAPVFFPGETKSLAENKGRVGRYMGLYNRTYLWNKGKSFTFTETELGKEEIHLSFMREGSKPLQWEWWINGPETYDYPFIAVQSKDAAFTTALGFEDGNWASINSGDERACYHLFPAFGDIEPGKSSTVRGIFYMMPGTSEDALKQFRKDYPDVE